MGKLQGKTAVITGGASGIGAATAQLFAKEGAKLVLVDLNEEKGQAFASELPDALFIKADITDEAQVQNVYAQATEKYGQIDIVFNNAGIGKVTPTHELSYDEWRKTVNVDLDGVFLVAREAIRAFKKMAAVSSSIPLRCMAGSALQGPLPITQRKAGLSI